MVCIISDLLKYKRITKGALVLNFYLPYLVANKPLLA
jgi:hypothetical protein